MRGVGMAQSWGLTACFSLESDQRLMLSLYPSEVGVNTFESLMEAWSSSTKSGSLRVRFGTYSMEPIVKGSFQREEYIWGNRGKTEYSESEPLRNVGRRSSTVLGSIPHSAGTMI